MAVVGATRRPGRPPAPEPSQPRCTRTNYIVGAPRGHRSQPLVAEPRPAATPGVVSAAAAAAAAAHAAARRVPLPAHATHVLKWRKPQWLGQSGSGIGGRAARPQTTPPSTRAPPRRTLRPSSCVAVFTSSLLNSTSPQSFLISYWPCRVRGRRGLGGCGRRRAEADRPRAERRCHVPRVRCGAQAPGSHLHGSWLGGKSCWRPFRRTVRVLRSSM